MARRPKFTSRQITRHGKPIWYFRRNGRRIRLPDEFGTDEWWTAYDAALAGKPYEPAPNRRHGRFAGLVHSYLDSRAFLDLAKNTRMQRTRLLKDTAEKAGNAKPEQVTQQTIREVMQTRPAFAANNWLKAMRGFYKWAIAMGHVDTDPTQGVARNNPKTEGWKIWTPEHIERFRRRWGLETEQRVCFEIAIETGLRRSDLIRLSGEHHKGDHVKIRAEKTGVLCYIPMTDNLDTCMRTGPMPCIRRESGKPFPSAETLGNWFNKACKEADIPDGMRLHSLRKTAASLDAENGWTANELMAKYGWLDIREAELYTRQADRKNLALGAGKRV
jgi:integrase